MPHLAAAYFAARASLESPCKSKRGIVIWDQYGVVSVGHNHQPSPFICDRSDRCKAKCGKTSGHAEQHAIVHAERRRLAGAEMLYVKTEGGKPVESMAPSCLERSKLILDGGIAWVCSSTRKAGSGTQRLRLNASGDQNGPVGTGISEAKALSARFFLMIELPASYFRPIPGPGLRQGKRSVKLDNSICTNNDESPSAGKLRRH